MAVVDDLGQPGMDSSPPSEDFGRQPPQDLAAEQSVLGGMLLSKDAIADVLEKLRPGDFYRPAHQNVYDAILDLYGRGEPADAVTVAAELDRRGLLRRIGGAPYVHTLISTVPTAANAGYYAEIVAEKALLRRLVEAGTRVVQYGYAGAEGADVNEVVDRAQAEIYDVTERRSTSEDFVPLEQLLQPTMDEIDAIASSGGISRGVPTGFTELDEVTNGLHPGQMIIVAARPGVGKSTLGLDFMRSCSIKHRMASVIFSLEMSKSEIVMRLLSAEAKIKLADMRSGRMSDDDWTRLARRMSEISEAPLFIDDSPNLTMMEIRAKARRLSQKSDLRLIVVDYMQLMTSGKKFESRQQEVSEFSRSLKLMAKELEVPVVAISQLNRGPEQRTDKKPMVSDLRESGCLTASTRILRADNGAEVTFGELMQTGERPLVWSLDERKRMVARPMSNVFYSGHKEVFRLRLASGREVEATANHPFMTLDGWTPLGELTVGDRLAVPRIVPEPVDTQRMVDEEVILLAHMIGDGSCVKRQPIRYASIDEENLAAVGGCGQALRCDGRARRLPGGSGDHAAAAGAIPVDARKAQSDRGVAGPVGVVRQAQPREVCAGRGFRAADRSGGAVPAAPVGNGWIGAVGCEGRAGSGLLRIDEPAIGRRRLPAAAPRGGVLPHQARPEGRVPRFVASVHLWRREPAEVPAPCRGERSQECRCPRGDRETGDAHPQYESRHRAEECVGPCPERAGGQGHDSPRVLGGNEHQVLRIDDVEARSEQR